MKKRTSRRSSAWRSRSLSRSFWINSVWCWTMAAKVSSSTGLRHVRTKSSWKAALDSTNFRFFESNFSSICCNSVSSFFWCIVSECTCLFNTWRFFNEKKIEISNFKLIFYKKKLKLYKKLKFLLQNLTKKRLRKITKKI